MTKFQNQIERQLEFNQGKNLFYNKIINSLSFSRGTIDAIGNIGSIGPVNEELLIDYLTNRAIEEFCKTNQYYTFDKKAQLVLRNLYAQLFVNIKGQKFPISSIASVHYTNLVKWLKETNSFAEKIYSSKGEIIEPVACSEYSAELQIAVLQFDIQKIKGPVLDIGCGKQGNLVQFLREKGIEAYGFDRFAYENPFLWNSDWLNYKFEKNKWGAIVSNLGFSNHFQHHHHRNDGSFVEYARKYMEILSSLKVGGCFHYAPDLPFIEKYFNDKQFAVEKHDISQIGFKTTIVTRLK